MAQLLDIFSFLAVLLRGATLACQSLVLGGILFAQLILRGQGDCSIQRKASRLIIWSALALALVQSCYVFADTAILAGTAKLAISDITGAIFFLAGCTTALMALLIAAIMSRFGVSRALLLPAAVILTASVFTSHAAARVEGRIWLMALTALHQLASAAWVGGLPYLLLTLSQTADQTTAQIISRRFSYLALCSVTSLIGAGLGLAVVYIGSVPAIYGTSYGAMVISKIILTGLLLLLGAFNFLLVGHWRPSITSHLLARLRRFSEAEIGIGFTVILAAAALTSQPPAADLMANQRATLAEIWARVSPSRPRLQTPSLNELSPPMPLTWNSNGLESSIPGATYRPPKPGDIAWSEYNHHWAGIVVLAIGILAVLARTGRFRWARHWPLAFFGLAVFLLLRADPESWPLGPKGFWESFSASDVTQHRLFVLLIIAFAIFEWGIQTDRLRSRTAALVFPAVCALGGALLLTHSHALSNLKEELLVEWSHIPLALFAVVAGWSRWLELRLPGRDQAALSWIWPVCFVMIGFVLLMYREA